MLETGRADEAERRFAAALVLAPHDVPSRVGLGIAVLRRGDAERAAAIFRIVTDERPLLPLPWVGLASALLELGRIEEATACCDRALRLAPGDRGALALREAARKARGESGEPPP